MTVRLTDTSCLYHRDADMAVGTSETSVNLCVAKRHSIPQDGQTILFVVTCIAHLFRHIKLSCCASHFPCVQNCTTLKRYFHDSVKGRILKTSFTTELRSKHTENIGLCPCSPLTCSTPSTVLKFCAIRTDSSVLRLITASHVLRKEGKT
jgi:hypothetical protein